MLIGLINKSLAIYGVLGKACPEHGGVLSVVECDRAGGLFYSSTRIGIKCCLLFLQALFHTIPVIPICSFDLTTVVNICESVPLDRSSMHATFVYFIISSCSL